MSMQNLFLTKSIQITKGKINISVIQNLINTVTAQNRFSYAMIYHYSYLTHSSYSPTQYKEQIYSKPTIQQKKFSDFFFLIN